MGKPLIMVTSITYAMKGRQILLDEGFHADLMRTPRNSSGKGCGYSIYVPTNTDSAEKVLIDAGIKVLGRTDGEGRI